MNAPVREPVGGARVPPSDLDAEATVISALLLDPATYDDVATFLRPEHCYANANRLILEAVWALRALDKPVDSVAVASWLRDNGKLQSVGGTAYLCQVCDATPAVANAEEHAKRLLELWRLRQLIQTCQRTAGEGYANPGEGQKIIDQHEQAVFELAHTSERTEITPIKSVVLESFQRLSHAASIGGVTGVPTGFADMDKRTTGLHPGDEWVVAGRPGMGKSSFALQVALNVAQRQNLGVAIFSLEMPKEQLGMRMLSTEARVDLGRIRAGQPRMNDWSRLTEASNMLARLPIWIDDTAGMGLAEIRAKVRRVQAQIAREHERTQDAPAALGLVVVDYLQLMHGRRDAATREQEVSELSRGMKQLAKEMGVPVMALSQLNRSVESRATKDKRPQLSDLRECLVGDTVVFDAITGRSVTVRELAAGAQSVVYGLRELDYRVAVAPVARAWSTGVKPVLRLRTASGRTIRATGNHPFRTIVGWQELGAIAVGERIAVPRVLPQHILPVNRHSADELRLLGYLISDGHYGKHRSVGYVKGDHELVADVCRIALDRFGITAKDHPCAGTSRQVELTVPNCGPHGNPLIEWLRAIGVHGEIGHEKRVPESVFECDNGLLGVFLGALWSGDGSVVPRKPSGWCLKFSSTSMGLLDDVQRALLRLGIISARGKPGRNSKSTRDIAVITIGDGDAIRAFAEMVPLRGEKARKLVLAVQAVSARIRENAHIDRIPLPVTEMVKQAAGAEGINYSQLGYVCQGKEMARAMLSRVAARLGREDLSLLACSDILWDKVESIEPDGAEEVFDVSVPGMGNFVADGVFVHNSGAIEQDADTVLLLYRDEYYFRDESRERGIAEVIIAKQRNGPTGVVKLKFTSEYTRFDNLLVGGSYEDDEFVGGNDELPPIQDGFGYP